MRLIATRIAGQRICLARCRSAPAGRKHHRGKGAGNELEPLDSHPLLNVLADPSDLHTAWSLMFSTVASLELTGRALWWTTFDNGRRCLYHLPTKWIEAVSPRRDAWKIRPEGATDSFTLPGSEIVHFFYPDPTDPLGCLSPLQRIAEAVVADESIQESQWRAFQNSMRPGLALIAGRLPDSPTGQKGERPIFEPHQRRELIEAIRQIHQGVVNIGEPLILDGLIEDVKPIFKGIGEMDFLDSSKLTKSRILQGFGVSPILLGEVEGANRASATVADEIFVANKVNPLCELLSQAMTEWLGPIFSSGNEKLAIWIEPAVARDAEQELQRWETAAKFGFVSQNEFRRYLLNLPDVEGGEKFMTPAMMLPRDVR